MKTLAEMFLSEGAGLETSANAPFLPHGWENVWLVESGEVNLFSVRIENRTAAGRRVFRACIPAGHLLFGMDLQGREIGLLAVGLEGTRLRLLSRSRLEELLRENVRAAEGKARLVEWVTDLGRIFSARQPPRGSKVLEEGTPLSLEDGQSLHAAHSVCWVHQLSGKSCFLGFRDLPPLAPGARLPLSQSLWLQADGPAVFQTDSAHPWFQDEGTWNGLDVFHNLCLQALQILTRCESSEEHALFNKTVEIDSGNAKAAEACLASVLNRRITFQALLTRNMDPLLAAFRIVGDHLGIKIEAPADALLGARSPDPIGDIARVSQVRVRRVTFPENWWRRDSGPLIAFRESSGAPVALIPTSPRGYDLIDPSSRERAKVSASLAASLAAEAYAMYRPFPPGKLTALDVLRFGLFRCSSDVWTVVWMGLLSGLLGLALPFLTSKIFDQVIPSVDTHQLGQFAWLLTCGILGSSMFQLVRGFALIRLDGRVDVMVQSAVWDRLLDLPVPFFRKYSVGDLTMRAQGINTIHQTLSSATLSTLLSSVFTVFSLGLMIWYSWKLAFLATVLSLMAVLAATFASYLQILYQRSIIKSQGLIAGVVLQFLAGISKLRVAGAETRAFGVWSQLFSAQRKISYSARMTSNAFAVFDSFFPIFCTLSIYLVLVFFLKGRTEMSIGHFMGFSAAFGQFLSATLSLSSVMISILQIIPLWERAQPILVTPSEVSPERSDPRELSGAIEMSHVTFSYLKGGPVALKDFSMSIRPGQFVAIVGPTGAGKSTLLRLLLGFEQPDSGAIYYDGQNLNNLDLRLLRRRLGVVLQNGRLIAGDIFTNIVGASSHLTEEDAWEGARMAGFDEDIRRMPMGMRTFVSEGASTISGGQRQRLMIARALVTCPSIVLFDEATSALDNRTQAIVRTSLEKLHATRVVIAHRLSTIIKADFIYAIADGVLQESGAYEELMARQGLFSQLAQRQLE